MLALGYPVLGCLAVCSNVFRVGENELPRRTKLAKIEFQVPRVISRMYPEIESAAPKNTGWFGASWFVD